MRRLIQLFLVVLFALAATTTAAQQDTITLAGNFVWSKLTKGSVPPHARCEPLVRSAIAAIYRDSTLHADVMNLLRSEGCLAGTHTGIFMPSASQQTNEASALVQWREEEGGVFYIKISSFHSNQTAERFIRAARRITARRSVRGIILDLRGNTGGYLDEMFKVLNVFSDKKDLPIMTEMKPGTRDILYVTGVRGIFHSIPVMVLMNETTASASEIVAGTLKNWGRAVLFGQRTYGKSEINTEHTDDVTSLIVVSYAGEYCIGAKPRCRSIRGVGLEPDITIARVRGKDLEAEAALHMLQGSLMLQQVHK